MDELVFTPSAVLALLTEIEEFKNKEISFQEKDDKIVLKIDTTEYILDTTEATDLRVDDYTVDTVADVNEEGYQDLEDTANVTFEEADEAVEGGIIKELAKTLLVGGLVRLTNKAIKNS